MSILAQRNDYASQQTLVRAALNRYKGQGFALDPDDEDHRQAYMTLKKNILTRVTGERVLRALKSAKDETKTGASLALNVYGVPVVNFPGGLPIDLKTFLKAADDLKDFATGVDLNFSSYYLLDDSAPRERLGLNVKTLNFFQKVQTTVDLGQPEAARQPQAPGVIPEILDRVTGFGQPEAARQPQAPRSLKRLASATADESSELDSAVKRRRLLGDILIQRRADLITAADKGDWHGSSHWSQEFVATHIDELVVVLKQIIADEPVGGPRLAKKVGAFVQDVFLDRPMYVHLHNFKGVFPQFAQLSAAPGAEPAATGAGEQLEGYAYVLEHMAHFSADQVTNLDLSKVDVITRNTFRNTLFYQNFCEHSYELLMKEAREKFGTSEMSATDGTRFRFQDLLSQACEVGATLTKGHSDTAAAALKFFDPDTQGWILLDAFIAEPAKIAPLLKDFAPMAPITLACQLLLDEQQPFSTWSFPKFVSGAEYLIAQDVGSAHPLVDACLTLLQSLGSASPGLKLTEIPKPLGWFASKLVGHRLGVAVSADVASFEPHQWLENLAATGAHDDGVSLMITELHKITLEFYKESPKSGKHALPWVIKLKQFFLNRLAHKGGSGGGVEIL